MSAATLRPLLALQRRAPLLQATALGALVLYGIATIPGFASAGTLDTILVLAALLGLASLGQTCVVILGGLDLSIPGFIVMGAALTGKLAGEQEWPFVVVLALIVALAAAIGGFNGWICHRQRIQPLILTLATSAMVAGGVTVWLDGPTSGSPPAWISQLTSPVSTTLGIGVPPVVFIWLVVALLVGFVVRRTVTGRRLYATGANLRAADLALVPTRRIWAGAFALSAICSALVGVLLAGFVGASDPSIGDPYLFEGLTAVIVGGTVFSGARGDYWHTVVGALILVVLTTILVGEGFSGPSQQMLFGVLILLVVAAYGRERRIRDRV